MADKELIEAVAGAMGIGVPDFHKFPESVKAAALKMYGDNVTLTKAMSGGDFSLHVGQKGGIVIRGFGNFPHTFFSDQWDRFAGWLKGGGFDAIAKFQKDYATALKTKAAAVVANKQAGS